MYKAIYAHLFQTFGRLWQWWIALAAEVIATILLRILTTVVMAQLAANVASGDIDAAKRQVIVFLILNIVGAALHAVSELVAVQAENACYGTMLKTFYQRLASKDMSFYRDHQTGYLTSLLRQYVDGTLQVARLIRGDIARSAVAIVAPVIVMAIADWQLGLVALGIVIVQLIYVFWSSSKADKWRLASHEIYRKLTGEVADVITNIVAYKSSGMEQRGYQHVSDLTDQETETFWLRRKTTTLLDLPRALITSLGVVSAFWLVLSNSSGTPETVGLVVLTLTYMFQLLRVVGDLPNLIVLHDDWASKAYPTLPYLTDEHAAIADPAEPKQLHITKGTIRIQNVDFSYPAHSADTPDIPVFQGLSLDIKGGEQVGIVGLSGAGKSTLASLLMRFDDVRGGSITIDGTDIREVRQSELRSSIAYVPQEPLLFHRSIRENIAYFHDAATDKAIIRAAKAAHAHEFIAKLPNGYDTIVGERGLKLSGGQKQRVVIARAILKNAPIMLFDEATSALDSESEQIIQRALPQIMGKHTAIIIAHRLSTVAGLDRIIVMHHGKVIEQGTHEALLAMKGRYHGLWSKQTNGQ